MAINLNAAGNASSVMPVRLRASELLIEGPPRMALLLHTNMILPQCSAT